MGKQLKRLPIEINTLREILITYEKHFYDDEAWLKLQSSIVAGVDKFIQKNYDVKAGVSLVMKHKSKPKNN